MTPLLSVWCLKHVHDPKADKAGALKTFKAPTYHLAFGEGVVTITDPDSGRVCIVPLAAVDYMTAEPGKAFRVKAG